MCTGTYPDDGRPERSRREWTLARISAERPVLFGIVMWLAGLSTCALAVVCLLVCLASAIAPRHAGGPYDIRLTPWQLVFARAWIIGPVGLWSGTAAVLLGTLRGRPWRKDGEPDEVGTAG